MGEDHSGYILDPASGHHQGDGMNKGVKIGARLARHSSPTRNLKAG